MLNVHTLESGLETWQHSFLDEPLQNQWDSTQPNETHTAAGLHHVKNLTWPDIYPAPLLADAARQPLHIEHMDPGDVDGWLASLDNSLPTSPVGLQQHAEQMQADNQPIAELDAAVQGHAQDHLEIRQAEGNVPSWQLYGTNDKVQLSNLLCFSCLAICY